MFDIQFPVLVTDWLASKCHSFPTQVFAAFVMKRQNKKRSRMIIVQ